MKLFVDANILVSVINHEYPLYNFSSRILSLTNKNKFEIFTSPLNLAIAFFFAEKKCSSKRAKEKVNIIQKNLRITDMTESDVKQALANKSMEDFEDGMQYYSALRSKCDCILTEDLNDFYFSEIEVINCKDFMMKYLFK
jgi:predicted nucleic acid-binding protein